MGKRYSRKDAETIRRLFPDFEALMREFPDRTRNALTMKAFQLGLKKPKVIAGTPWAKAEIDILCEHYRDGYKAVARLLPGRTENAIRHKAMYLRLSPKNRWTAEDKAILREHFDGPRHVELPRMLKRSKVTINAMARELGLKRSSYWWSKAEDDLLRKHYPTMTPMAEIMRLLPHRKYEQICYRARYIGLHRPLEISQGEFARAA